MIRAFFLSATLALTIASLTGCSKSAATAHLPRTDAPAVNAKCIADGKGDVDPKVNRIEYQGKAYGFCCESCVGDFEKDPAKYVNAH